MLKQQKNPLKKYNITKEMLSQWFKYSSPNSFSASSAKNRIVIAVECIIKHVEEEILNKIQG